MQLVVKGREGWVWYPGKNEVFVWWEECARDKVGVNCGGWRCCMPAFASRQGSKHHLDGENKKLEGRWAFFLTGGW